MRYLAAYLLLQIGGNSSPSAADIKKVLAAGSVDVDEDRLNSLISELEGKDINELIAEGNSKLASVRIDSVYRRSELIIRYRFLPVEVLLLLRQLLRAEGDLRVVFREYAHDPGGHFVMDDSFVVLADDVDTEFLDAGGS